MKINTAGLNLVKRWEGYHKELPDGRCEAYLDKLAAKKYWSPGYRGLWTIGWGCTEGVTEGLIWTRKQAENYLLGEISKHETAVTEMVTVPINDNQFSALVSLSYNIGVGRLRKSSVIRKLNAGDYDGAASAISLYRMAGNTVYKGLVDRRAAEKALFLRAPTKEIVKESRKLRLLERLRLLLPIGGVGTWITWENLGEFRQFLSDYSGFLALGIGVTLWAVFKLLEVQTMEDYEEGRYEPSGARDAK